MSTSPELKWLHIDEAAELFKVTTRTLYRRIKQGKYSTEKRYGRVFIGIDVSSVELEMSQMSVTATDENVSQASQMSDNTDTLSVADVGAEGVRIRDEDTNLEANYEMLCDEGDALRDEVEKLRNDLQRSQTQLSESLASANALNKQNESLVNELSFFRQQVEESRVRSDSIIMKLTQQLEQSNLQLQDFGKKTVWQRVKAVFVPSTA